MTIFKRLVNFSFDWWILLVSTWIEIVAMLIN